MPLCEDWLQPVRDHIQEGDLLAVDKALLRHVLTDCFGKPVEERLKHFSKSYKPSS